jgi:hypothetical protein
MIMDRSDIAGTMDPLSSEVANVLGRMELVPDDVVWQAKAAFAWRELTNVIATLEYDSALDEDDALAGVRGTGSDRVLRFAGQLASASLYISDAGRRLMGHLEPNTFRSVILCRPSGSVEIDVDSTGTFFVERIQRGLLSLKCLPVDPMQRTFETEWVTI